MRSQHLSHPRLTASPNRLSTFITSRTVRSVHAYDRGTRHDPRVVAIVHVVRSIILRVRHLAVWDVRHLRAHNYAGVPWTDEDGGSVGDEAYDEGKVKP
jgi:hypothetical protein